MSSSLIGPLFEFANIIFQYYKKKKDEKFRDGLMALLTGNFK